MSLPLHPSVGRAGPAVAPARPPSASWEGAVLGVARTFFVRALGPAGEGPGIRARSPFAEVVRLLTTPGLLALAALLTGIAASAEAATAQSVSGIDRDLLEAVMPRADRFEPKAGDPPVLRAFRGGELLGFVFLTEDVPPEQLGYSGPVQAVVGLRLDGTVAGARVTEYWESYRSSMGDFLRDPGVQEQFAGKSLTDPFLVNGDVARVTRATISTQALARGIRDASRRVAEAYAAEMSLGALDDGPLVLEEMTWFEMRTRGVLKRILIESPEGHLEISMTRLPDDSVAAFFVGEGDVERIHAEAARWDRTDYTLVLYALDGPRLRFFIRDNWHVAQDGDTTALHYSQVYNLGTTEEGRVADESTLAGVFMLEDEVDPTRPFSLLYELEGHEGYYAADFEGWEEEPAAVAATAGEPEGTAGGTTDDPGETGGATAPERAEAEVAAAAGDPAEGAEDSVDARGGEAAAGGPDGDDAPVAGAGSSSTDAGENPRAGADPAPDSGEPSATGLPASQGAPLDLGWTREESELERTLASTDWGRTGRMALVVALALLAFFLKRPALRWLSLGATLVVLGWLDAAFLSVSHVTAGIWVGPDVYFRDLPLLLLVGVTVATVLVWGRVFCGFLCPFGALQDVLERVVPRRFRVRVPWSLHRAGLTVKYGILAVVVGAGLVAGHLSLYQWVEPFGTVFFPSRSAVLWAVAALFLLGSALIPRFYCRYACPLGAGLALASFLSLRRIPRVEQCDVCKVCEQDCPTGAIEGPRIAFHECVRCNRCEVNLREEAGACRHEMADVRSRLVQIDVPHRSRAGV